MSRKINRSDLEIFFDYDIHVPTRTVYIGPASGDEEGVGHGINYAMAERTVKALMLLDSTDGEITCILNSGGGEVENGWAIFDAIKNCRNHVSIKVYGQASSMGAIILQSADTRLMTKNSTLMIHYGSIGVGSTHVKDFHKMSDWYRKDDDKMEKLFLEKIREHHPNFKESKIKDLIKYDWYLTAEEALEYNLIDGIVVEQGVIEKEKP